MIFAKLDVCFWRDKKFKRAGAAAAGYWAAVLAWLRDEETEDGIIPFDMLGEPLSVGPKQGRRFCDRLQREGLFVLTVSGFELVGYSKKNEVRSQIEDRREATRLRVAQFRRVRNADTNTTSNGVTNTDRNAGVTGSGSDSLSVFVGTRDPEQPNVGPHPVSPRGPDGTMTGPPDALEVTKLMRDQCIFAGARPPEPEHVAAFLANAREKGHIAADWGAGLVKWMIRQKGYDARPHGNGRPEAPTTRYPVVRKSRPKPGDEPVVGPEAIGSMLSGVLEKLGEAPTRERPALEPRAPESDPDDPDRAPEPSGSDRDVLAAAGRSR